MKTRQAITRCETCNREENGVHDQRSCPRCHAAPAMQFVRWIKPAPIPATKLFGGAIPFGGITGEKWS